MTKPGHPDNPLAGINIKDEFHEFAVDIAGGEDAWSNAMSECHLRPEQVRIGSHTRRRLAHRLSRSEPASSAGAVG